MSLFLRQRKRGTSIAHDRPPYLMQDGLDIFVVSFALQLSKENFGGHSLRREIGSQGSFVTVKDAVEISIVIEDDADRSILELVQWSSESIL